MTDAANRFAFVTNLGSDAIAQLTFDAATGKLLLVANQGSSDIVAFQVNEATGALRPTGRVTEVPEPTYVGIAASPGP
ncbi:beta-propeller fold lactonase family protein [Sorangium sp. So ce363]|uniref:beta-propeller fold lactonase family protein n=1 Tax=Sorangium sp. So ce363 TaxID=3133304 RepID=UPI003F608BA8